MRLLITTIGALFGLVAGIALAIWSGLFTDLEALPPLQRSAFVVCGVGITMTLAALGTAIARYLAGTPRAGRAATERQMHPDRFDDVIVAELVEPGDTSAATTPSTGIASRLGRWGWVFACLGIMLAAWTGLQAANAKAGLALLAAVVAYCTGILCSTVGLLSAWSRKPRGQFGQALTGLILSFACFLCILVSASGFLGKLPHQARTVRQARPQPLARSTTPSKPLTLQQAIDGNRAEVARSLLKEGADPNVVYRDGKTPLFQAAALGHTRIVELLLEHGANANGDGNEKYFPLRIAVERGHFDVANTILDHDLDPALVARHKHLLHYALMRHGGKIIGKLLAKGADPNALSHDSYTPLQRAIREDNSYAVRLLLQNGANPNLPLGTTRRPLAQALEKQDPELVRQLVAHGAQVYLQSTDPIKDKITTNLSPRCIPALVEAGDDLIVPDGRRGLLFLAVAAQKVELVQALIDTGVDLDAPLSDKQFILTAAVRTGDLALVKLLLDARRSKHNDESSRATIGDAGTNGADPYLDDRFNRTPLAAAIAAHNGKMIRLLASHGIKVRFRDGDDHTLEEAVRWGDADSLQEMVDVSDEAILPNGKQKLLVLAIAAGQVDLVQSLIAARVDPSAALPNHKPPLVEAVQTGNTTVTRMLLDVCPKPFPSGLMNAAVESGHPAMVRLLIDSGEELNASHVIHAIDRRMPEMARELLNHESLDITANAIDSIVSAAIAKRDRELALFVLERSPDLGASGSQSLHAAAKLGAVEIVRALIAKGAKVSALNDTKIPVLADALYNGDLELLTLLIDNGADPNVRTKSKGTALHVAATRSSLEVVDLLAGLTRSIDVRDSAKRTPLHQAARRDASQDNNAAVIRCLLKHGADLEAQDGTKMTALCFAVESKNHEGVKALLEAGVEVNVLNAKGETPLHLAAIRRDSTSLGILLRHGADQTIRNAGGLTPHDIATSKGMDVSVFDEKSEQ